jgi:uncharacterized protein with NAD-binding domain and iron-sulfur cluster
MGKEQIAILGGGMGALAAAFELTSYEGWDTRYDVTVYQVGWRLGGKCATGRDASIRNRIEEHGIHFLLGFYENAFHLIRKLYDEDIRPEGSPFSTWRDAFRNQSTSTAMVLANNVWSPFGIEWPKNEDLPGDDSLFGPGSKPPRAWDYIAIILSWMKDRLQTLHGEVGFIDEDSSLLQLENLVDQSYEISRKHLDPPKGESEDLAKIMDFMTNFGELVVAELAKERWRADPKQYLILLDIAAAMIRGMITDGVIFDGFEKIDNREMMRWLKDHGCHFPDSSVVRSGYDACFAYIGGDQNQPSMSAAVGLHGALRLWFTYKGTIYWPMQAGMAEVIFAPLYRVLSKRGVKFRFFHRVKRLNLSADKQSIQSIEIDIQATLKDPDKGYQPFVHVKGLDCWPNEPLYGQLVNGDQFRDFDMESAWTAPPPVSSTTLVRDQDFSRVILGISLGAIPDICSDLVSASPKWKDMVDHIPTVQTQALQLWLRETAAQLGYSAGTIWPSRDAACVSSFVEPFDTYVDMSAIQGREEWLPSDQVKHLAYFCNVLPDANHTPAPGTDPTFPQMRRNEVKKNAIDFLSSQVSPLWPKSAVATKGFDWRLLVDVNGVTGPKRFDSQYWRANIDPSSRYVLSPPNAIHYRLKPNGSGFDNLYLAGDWTYTPMNSGCVEAATMSGFRASQSICGYPVKIYSWD